MTKDFKQPRRDDDRRSFSRHTSSDFSRAERPFKPAHSRLHRDTVDRAWENGANHQHADYQPRRQTPRPPFQQHGHTGPATGRSQQPYNRSGYGTRQEHSRGSSPSNPNYQRRERGPETSRRPSQGSGYRSSAPYPNYQRREQERDGYRRTFNDTEYRRFSEAPHTGPWQAPESGERRFGNTGNRAPGGQSRFQDERWNQNQRGSAQPYRGSEERYQGTRSPRFPANNFDRQQARPESRPYPFERGNDARPNFTRGRRAEEPQWQRERDTYHPRGQNRPEAHSDYQPARRDHANPQRQPSYGRPTSEQFEGDYERFDAQPTEQAEYREQHVTHLPDGRVLKGSRSSQRKQAQFWNEVTTETNMLVHHTPSPSDQTEPAPAEEAPAEELAPSRPRTRATAKPKVVRTVKTTYSRGTGGMKSIHGSKAKALKRKTQGTPGTNTRPSKRGYKWPTSGESGQ